MELAGTRARSAPDDLGRAADADVLVTGAAPVDLPLEGKPELGRARRLPARLPLGRLAAAIIAVGVLLRAWVGARGWFSLDDVQFVARALEHPFGAHEAFTAYNGHLMPGAFAWVWATTRLAPWSFAPVILVMLLLVLAADVACYRVLVQLFGRRPAVLLPLAVYALSPLTLPMSVWWAAAMNQLPQHLATFGVLGAQVAYSRSGRTRTGLLGVAALLAGLAFSEKTLLAVPLAALVTLLYLVPGRRPVPRVLGWLRRQAPVVAAYAVVCGAYAGYYLTHVRSQVTGRAGTADDVDVVGSALAHAVLPGVVGGPWRWARIGLNDGLADPPSVLVVVVVVAALALVQVAALVGQRAVRALVVFGSYTAMVLGLVLATRAGIVGPLIARETRYLADLALVAALSLGLAFLPVREAPGVATAAGVARPVDPVSATVAGWLRRLAHPALGAAAVVGLVASSTVSAAAFGRIWASNPTRSYVQTAQAQVAADGPVRTVADIAAPGAVMSPFQYPYTRPSAFLLPHLEHARVLTPGTSSDELEGFDLSGHLRPAVVTGPTGVPAPQRAAHGLWVVGDHEVPIPLTSALDAGQYVVRLGYLASADTDLEVHAGRTCVVVPLKAGFHVAYVGVEGAVDSVRVRARSTTATVRTDDLTVGFPYVPGTPL